MCCLLSSPFFLRSPGGNGGDSTCPTTGHPFPSVNLFTGDLVITDMPLSHDSPGSALPFVMSYSAQATENTVVGPHWTHSYNLYYIDNMPTGITFVDGNNRHITYPWDAVNQRFGSPSMVGLCCHASQSSDENRKIGK